MARPAPLHITWQGELRMTRLLIVGATGLVGKLVLEQALADARIAAPLVPVFANVTAAPVSDPDTIRRLLVEQVTGMVRWRESVLAMNAAGVDRFVEFGGKVLAPMVKRIAPDVETTSVITMDDLEALAKGL